MPQSYSHRGDPLKRDDILELIRYAEKKGLKLVLFSHGASFAVDSQGNIDKDKLRTVLKNIYYLNLSVDIYHLNSYMRIYKYDEDSYFRLIGNILEFIADEFPDIKVRIVSVVGKMQDLRGKNLEEKEVVAFLKKIGIAIYNPKYSRISHFSWSLNPFRFVGATMHKSQRKYSMERGRLAKNHFYSTGGICNRTESTHFVLQTIISIF